MLLVLVWAAGALTFFRRPIFSGFRFITGDNGDTRLIIYLHEHWLQVLRGLSSWRDPSFFFPTSDTLGYSDTFILNELFYAPLRLAGLDIYLAYQGTLILLSLVGFLGSYFLLRRVLPQRQLCAVLALTFAFSNMLYVQAGHTQLYSVYWLPTVVLLVLRARTERRKDLLPAFLAGLLLGLLFLSTFYVSWFFVLSALLWRILRWALAPGRTAWRTGIRLFLADHRRRVAVFTLGAAIGGIPFLIVYLPNLGAGGRSLAVALGYASEPRDIVNTGARNYFWGPLTRSVFGSSPRITNGELGFGLTPVLLVALIAATAYLLQRSHFLRRSNRSVDDPAGAAPMATAITCWVMILLPMKFFGASLWAVVWLVVPGARAIRAIDRIGVIAGLLAPLVVAFVIADVLRRADQRRGDIRQRATGRPGVRRGLVVGSAAIVLLVALEQFNIGKNAGIDRSAELGAVAAVPLPSPACRAFYLTIAEDHPPLAFVSSIDAMLISQAITSRGGRAVPTINGFSGQFPPGYGSVADPGSSTYDADVRAWIASHGLSAGMCSYDPVARRWAG